MRKAFTLIELLIVVAIIAILAAIAVPNFLEAQVRAKVSRAKADTRTTVTALEAYAVDHNKYPPHGFFPPQTITDIQNGATAQILHWWVTTPVAYITSLGATAEP